MEELAKPRYLVGKPGDQKFKRNVPRHLQALAKKTAFVERVNPGSRAREVRGQGNLFAVRTDAELARLETIRARNDSGHVEPGSDDLHLTNLQARQLAVAYFVARDEENLMAGDYFASPDNPDFPDILSDAADAAQMALLQASGEYRTTSARVIKLLAEWGIISLALAERLGGGDNRSALRQHHAFQLLCRLVERADIALTERRYHSLNLGLLVSTRN